jgi:hypothetical protein
LRFSLRSFSDSDRNSNPSHPSQKGCEGWGTRKGWGQESEEGSSGMIRAGMPLIVEPRIQIAGKGGPPARQLS